MRMKLTVVLLFCAGILTAGQHVNEVSGPVKDAGTLEIVTEQPVPVVNYAAKELQTYLKKATGQNVPIVKKASGGKTALVLGDCPSARAAGVDVSKLPDEGFRILRKGNCIFIAGRDDPKQNPANPAWSQYYPRATLSGVYDFMERFADARFFFPGQYGTVVPAKKGLFLPEKIDITESPDMVIRNFYSGQAKSFDPNYTRSHLRAMQCQRLRLSEKQIYFGHGLSFLKLPERFGKTHPEYFALWNGKRYNDPQLSFPGQLCFNSGVREVIYQDVKAYFTGRPASERGMKFWNPQAAGGDYFCIMPQDAMHWCQCDKCRRISEPDKRTLPEGRQAISNFMFLFSAEIARRLEQDGIKGKKLTQMIYRPYDMVPDCEIPDSIELQIAVNGSIDPAYAEDDRRLEAWNRKLGHPISAWTYAMGKHETKAVAGLPQMMPKEAARFIRTYRKEINGYFWEAETEEYLFNYLNYYIAAKLMWNTALNPDALLEDHYRVMFGKGAPMGRKVFDELEKCWVKGIINHTVMDGLGPKVQMPSDRELWEKVYSPEKIAKFVKLFAQAQRAAASDGEASERVKFIRKHILDPLIRASKKYQLEQYSLDSWRVYCPDTVYLRPCKGEVNEVNTKVDIAKEDDALVFRFDCEEPRMSELPEKHSGRDDPMNWSQSAVEIFINPSGDRKNYYHFIVNSNGGLSDYRAEFSKKADMSWNSSAAVKIVKESGRWKAEICIPLKDLGPLAKAVPVNFARHRALTGKPLVKEPCYQWSPLPGSRIGGFHAIDRWGVLILGKAPEKMIPHGNFTGLESAVKSQDEWKRPWPRNGQVCKLDDRIFISGGVSLYYKNIPGKNINAGFKVPQLKPNTRYRLSYYIKTQDIKGKSGAGVYVSFGDGRGASFPQVKLKGTHPWHRLSFTFTTPASTGQGKLIPSVGTWIWFAEGEVWFDNVELIELPEKKRG